MKSWWSTAGQPTRRAKSRCGMARVCWRRRGAVTHNRKISRRAARLTTGFFRSTPTKQVTPELAAEIVALKKAGPAADGYSFPRRAQYLGRWIRHSGWYPDRKTRLYKRTSAEWIGEYVHESVRVKGAVGELHADLLHFTCDSLSDHLRTLDRYTTLAARELIEEETGPAPAAGDRSRVGSLPRIRSATRFS